MYSFLYYTRVTLVKIEYRRKTCCIHHLHMMISIDFNNIFVKYFNHSVIVLILLHIFIPLLPQPIIYF
jgi:hypothetical protein